MDLESNAKVKDNGKCDAKLTEGTIGKAEQLPLGTVWKTEQLPLGTVGKTEQLPLGSVGLSPSPATKGKGLKKWRRIHRESGKEGSNNFDSNRKRVMIASHVGLKQRSEGSSSSTNAVSTVLGNALDHNFVFGDLSSRKGPEVVSRADSDNSEDQNSRSSTAASVPRVNREVVPVVGSGFNLSGKSSVQNVTKKPRGFKIKKETSISSVESDSRSSNFVFLQAANSMTSNGSRRNGRSGNYDEDDSDDARNGDTLNYASHTTSSKHETEYEDLAGDDHVGSGDPDALEESIIPLHLAQEALEREVQKLRDVGKEDIVSSDADLQSKLEEAFSMLELKNTKISELESTINSTKIKAEYEELLTRRIAAEVEYLVISKTVENLKAGHMGRVNLTVEQKNVSSATEQKGLEEDAKKLETRVWRYVWCFIMQSVLLLVVLCIFVLKFSSKTGEVIPT